MNQGAVGDDAYIRAFFYRARLPKGNRKIRSRIFRAIVGLAVEVFMLEEEDRVVAADGRAQKAGYVQGGGRHHHAEAGTVREDRFAALTVIHAATGEVASDRHAKYYRRFESAVRTPAHHAELVSNLHHGRPDVVEELNLGNGL